MSDISVAFFDTKHDQVGTGAIMQVTIWLVKIKEGDVL